jgi:hypothetical protein
MSRPAVEIRPVEPGDIEVLLREMRAVDRAEARACGLDVEQGLRESIAKARFARTALINGRLAAIGGCGVLAGSTVLAPIGVPWLVGTDVLTRHPCVLQREARRYIAAMLEAYPHLMNVVHADNRPAVRWLRRLGFTLRPAQPAFTGALFHVFEMRA